MSEHKPLLTDTSPLTLSIWNYGKSSAEAKLVHHIIRFRSAIDSAQNLSTSIRTAIRGGLTDPDSKKQLKDFSSERHGNISRAIVNISKIRSLHNSGTSIDTSSLPSRIPLSSPAPVSEEQDEALSSELKFALGEENRLKFNLSHLDRMVHQLAGMAEGVDLDEAISHVKRSLKETTRSRIHLSRPSGWSRGNWERWSEVLGKVASIKYGVKAEGSQFYDGIGGR